MAKKKTSKKKTKTKKTKPTKKTEKRKAAMRKVAKRKQYRARGRAEVASITSGNEASTLDPKGQLFVETDEEASPGVHKGDMSGDLQGLSTTELYDSESVSELIEEGQDLEAELIEGVEEAPDADQGDVKVHEAPQKDVPDYKDRNKL